MIPSRLKMRNFMPYHGDIQPFSFDGIHTACICGDNGNGKSALIDAITWALWGKSRAKSDDDLIHLSEKDMEVEFDFFAEEQLYRVIRKHSMPKSRKVSGQSSLDLFIADNGGFNVISGDTKSKTQQKVISLLNMDYDTFINSAFLRQGHADEFSKQQPAKRKEVLTNILGLSIYDRLEDRARELSRLQNMEKTQLENAILEIEQELAKKQELEASLDKAQNELTLLEDEMKQRQSVLNRLRQERDSLAGKKQQLAQLEEHIAKTEEDLRNWYSRIEHRQKNIKEYHELIAERQSIEEGYHQFIQVEKLNDKMNKKLQLLNKIKDRKGKLEQVIHKAQAELLSEHAVSQSKIDQLESDLKKLSLLKEERARLENEQQRLVKLDEVLQNKMQYARKLQVFVHKLECSQQNLEQEVRDLEEKLVLLDTRDDASCPLCETKLGEDGIDIIRSKYKLEKEDKTSALDSHKRELSSRKIELKGLESNIQELETSLSQDRAEIQVNVGVIASSIKESEEVARQLDKERGILAEIENRLAIKDFSTQEQKALYELENELTAIDYNPDQHQRTVQRLAALEEFEQSKRRLDEAEKMFNLEQRELVNAREASQELSLRLESDNNKRQLLSSELKALPNLENEIAQAEDKYRLLSEKQKQAQEMKGSISAKLEHVSKQEKKQQEKKRRLEQVTKDAGIYLDLSQAFGKKGIQAMLIEMALPDIEIEANKLLSRMTDNRMHIKIETQRQSKKGEPIETLEIIISDELGPRPYENYSGGEAFRIDFAIRIALSRLLAKRAGAPIPTLIIDEGFGTQDNIGLEKVKEAINSIQDDFDKILVVTHIDELKDAFPTRINVIKTTDGSTLEVS
ncbi:MAG: SMC family ATPase [Dehalococcoidia bacterium]|nr:MAG: SMC family ATPase [Dehalococcoidia bacterium]